MTDVYKRAKRFKRQYPSAYFADIKETTNDIKETFTRDTCSCSGKSADVVEEFRLFIKTFPKDAITPLVRKRLADVLKSKSEIRFGCISG